VNRVAETHTCIEKSELEKPEGIFKREKNRKVRERKVVHVTCYLGNNTYVCYLCGSSSSCL